MLRLLLDARRARKQGPAAIAQRQRTRVTEMVAFARANSPYYRELYRNLPEGVTDLTLLPVTSKKELMARFDDWVTDREVTSGNVRKFVDNPNLVGEWFMGKYTVATTSGTTGTTGIFLLDDRSFAVTGVLALRMLSAWLTISDVIRIIVGGGRIAMIHATGGHFASAIAATRASRRLGKAIEVIPVHMSLPDMVTRLNRFRPAILAPYASMAALLASEQEAGRLQITPVLLVLSAEGLPTGEYDRITRVFSIKARNSYAATECPFLSYSCDHGWLHVNSDWLVLEPVTADYRPVSPGEQSDTVLISNLANRVQPILRYDLGDSVVQRSDPCPCGNPMPAIRVQGRAADVLTFPTDQGQRVSIPRLAFEIDHIPGIALFQIVQTTPTSLRVRLRVEAGVDPHRVRQNVDSEIVRLLNEHKLDHVRVEHADEPPEQSPGGKYRTVVPLNQVSK